MTLSFLFLDERNPLDPFIAANDGSSGLSSRDIASIEDIHPPTDINFENKTDKFATADDSSETKPCESITSYASVKSGVRVPLYQNVRKGIAFQLWPAATFLCDYLDDHLPAILSRSSSLRALSETEDVNPALSVVELGAGIGLCGIYLAKYVSKLMADRVRNNSDTLEVIRSNESKIPRISRVNVIITDLPEAMPLISANIELNKAEYKCYEDYSIDPSSAKDITKGYQSCTTHVEAAVLRWGNGDDHATILRHCQSLDATNIPTLIIAADCIYWESLFEIFADTLMFFASMGSTIIISHVKRWKKENRFFAICKKKGLHVEILHEVIDQVINENTNESSRRIRRIYQLSKPK